MLVLIVDDEPQSREGIVKFLPWNRWNIRDIHTARDGQEALDLSLHLHPDIVICDIRMPRMDGIRFIQNLYISQPDCRVIFLSGYANKEYLFTAIRLHVVAYVEKPYDVEELAAAVDEAVRQLSTQRGRSRAADVRAIRERRESLALVLLDPEADIGGIRAGLAASAIQPASAITSLSMSLPLKTAQEPGSPARREQALMLLCNRFNTPTHTYLLCAREGEGLVLHVFAARATLRGLVPILVSIAEELVGALCHIVTGVGETVSDLEGAAHSFQTARAALGEAFYVQESILWYAPRGREDAPEPPDGKPIVAAAERMEETAAFDALTAWVEAYRGQRADPQSVREAFLALAAALPEADARDAARIQAARHIDELAAFLRDRLGVIFEKRRLYRGGNRVVRDACAIIQAECGSPDLCIEEIARRVYLTPNYLSSVFKAETGQTMNEVITAQRIARAEALLRDPSLHLYQVAAASGFRSLEHFTRIFKKHRGVSPSTVRKQR